MQERERCFLPLSNWLLLGKGSSEYEKGPSERIEAYADQQRRTVTSPRQRYTHHRFSLQTAASPQCHLRAKEYCSDWSHRESRQRRTHRALESDRSEEH